MASRRAPDANDEQIRQALRALLEGADDVSDDFEAEGDEFRAAMEAMDDDLNIDLEAFLNAESENEVLDDVEDGEPAAE